MGAESTGAGMAGSRTGLKQGDEPAARFDLAAAILYAALKEAALPAIRFYSLLRIATCPRAPSADR